VCAQTRKDRLCGWYHSHPFPVGEFSNCFFSAVDVQTQIAWQMAFERMGDPFVGIVVDPLRSTAQGRPELGAFRALPPAFRPPERLGPDGKTYESRDALEARWGSVASSYTMVPISIFASSLSKLLSQRFAQEYLWTQVLASTPAHDRERRDALATRLDRVADALRSAREQAMGGGRAVAALLPLLPAAGAPDAVLRKDAAGLASAATSLYVVVAGEGKWWESGGARRKSLACAGARRRRTCCEMA
jgi:COP9 signalosome complex subunit 5